MDSHTRLKDLLYSDRSMSGPYRYQDLSEMERCLEFPELGYHIILLKSGRRGVSYDGYFRASSWSKYLCEIIFFAKATITFRFGAGSQLLRFECLTIVSCKCTCDPVYTRRSVALTIRFSKFKQYSSQVFVSLKETFKLVEQGGRLD